MAYNREIDIHSHQSSYRENLIEHLFIGELLRAAWPHRIEVMKPSVDDGGYDLVIEADKVIRHVQLKTSARDAKTIQQKVNIRLQEKPSGCVIWIQFHKDDFNLGPFWWFGNPAGRPWPDLSELKIARHTKGDSSGVKRERPLIRIIPKRKFRKVESISEVAELLFGAIN